MRCGRCGTPVDSIDNFCRQCGATLNRRGLPTIVSRSLLPVPWVPPKGLVLRGVAALVAGTAMELARRELRRRAIPSDPAEVLALLTSGQPTEVRQGRFPWSRVPRGEYEVTETVIQRSVRFFRR